MNDYVKMVRGIGFEPTTSTMSRCCSTTELTALLVMVRADYYPICGGSAILFLMLPKDFMKNGGWGTILHFLW